MIGSPEINKVIRQILSPTLKENGFDKVNTRHNWGWHNHCTWVFDITAVGKNFSDITGWSPMSVYVDLGIFYDFVPPKDGEIKIGTKNELIPKPHQCQLQKQLHCRVDQSIYTNKLDNPAEKKRNDIWWIEPNGSNIEEVINDIKQSFLSDGLEWLLKNTDLETAFKEIESEHDSFNKFYKARCFAEHLNDNFKFEEYSELLEKEQKRIDGLFS
ncbi:hypothetical protein AN964_22840 [Heyndrickxia shackletonii]|uniref:DUF4304 domain-containing protein n=1 Tax=Heyndrickxia shackletonii TaxID=157838 RepID=A0A0Q3TAD5_9BACI|nr:DUF4304 domain-containing protein [Heyndrickxia shackletonii]KQL50497.1 hypothetical protein AN964_22840 [Heyndrickxia shackletonii]NEZ02511.1 hypothetical protein [Heyndrickxia shackletonii]